MMSLVILTHTISNSSNSIDDTITCEMSIINKLNNDIHMYPYHSSYLDHQYITFNTENSMIFIQLSACDYDHDNYSDCYYQLNIINCFISSSSSAAAASLHTYSPNKVSVSPRTINIVTYPRAIDSINCDTKPNITYINLAFKTLSSDSNISSSSNNNNNKSTSDSYMFVIIMIILHILLKTILRSFCKHVNTNKIVNTDNHKYSNDEWRDECKTIKIVDNDNSDITNIPNYANDNIIEEFNAIIETIPDTDDGWARLFLDIYENKENRIDINADKHDDFPFKKLPTVNGTNDKINVRKGCNNSLPPQCWQSADDIPKHGRLPLKKVLLAPSRETYLD